jgi:hypothetical protein
MLANVKIELSMNFLKKPLTPPGKKGIENIKKTFVSSVETEGCPIISQLSVSIGDALFATAKRAFKTGLS